MWKALGSLFDGGMWERFEVLGDARVLEEVEDVIELLLDIGSLM